MVRRSQPLIASAGQRQLGLCHDAAGSNSSISPRPSQLGQAPIGELNENSRGSVVRRASSRRSGRRISTKSCGFAPSSSIDTTMARPLPMRHDVSNDSARRWLGVRPHLQAVDDDPMVCLWFFASLALAQVQPRRRRCAPREALGLELDEQLGMLALAVTTSGAAS